MALIFFELMSFTCKAQTETRILIYSNTTGYRHACIEVGREAIRELLEGKGIGVTVTEDSLYFNSDSLAAYRAVIFFNTTEDVLNEDQQVAFQNFIQSGKGFVGVHAAADTEYDWPWYGRLVGAYFESHPETQSATVKMLDSSHTSTSMLPKRWTRTDEWYNYKNISPNIKVLLEVDESSYDGGTNGEFHPIAWYHEYDGGRAFYTGFGHTEETYKESLFLEHLWGGIKYALGQ